MDTRLVAAAIFGLYDLDRRGIDCARAKDGSLPLIRCDLRLSCGISQQLFFSSVKRHCSPLTLGCKQNTAWWTWAAPCLFAGLPRDRPSVLLVASRQPSRELHVGSPRGSPSK